MKPTPILLTYGSASRKMASSIWSWRVSRPSAGKSNKRCATTTTRFMPRGRGMKTQRRDTRLELIGFLLRINARTQAQSELIALAASLGSDPARQAQVGDLLIQAQDYQDALAEYRLSLKEDHHSAAASAGAGLASFELGHYALAQRYLQAAVAANPNDTRSGYLLKTTDLVLRMDPYRPQISAAQRDRDVVEAFTVAGERLKACADGAGSPASTAQQGLAEEWAKRKPQITESGLKRDPDRVNVAMELVFNIERQTSACGVSTDTDRALLLIAKMHEGS